MAVGLVRREKAARFHKPSTFSRVILALCLLWTFLQQRSLHLRVAQDNYDRIIDPTDWEIQSKAANATTAVVTNAKNDVSPQNNAESSSATNDNNDKPFRKWAYAFVVGGALHPRAEYRGFLYSVVVAAKQLRDAGSVADVVVLVQLSYATGETKLPPEQEQLLQSQKVKIHYIPKFAAPVHEKFYALMMEKFRILSLTEYSRVIFLDSDVMPVCSLDHIFDLSEPKDGQTPQLKENVILAQKVEPSHGGFFMLTPSKENYEELQRIVRRREEEAVGMPFPHWDENVGWGHKFSDDDFWHSPLIGKGLKWDWHGSFADQGLLYYYTKYVKQSVSIIIWNNIENWGLGTNNTLQLEWLSPQGMLNQYSCVPPDAHGRYKPVSPYRDLVHFTGRGKPWHQLYENMEMWLAAKAGQDLSGDKRLRWYSALKQAIAESGLEIPMDFMGTRESVGVAPGTQQMIEHIKAKRKRGWSEYADDET